MKSNTETRSIRKINRSFEQVERIYSFAKLNNKKVYTTMPKGWRFVPGAMTAPNGSEWIDNGLSRFDKNRVSAILIID